jgi:hypothetical protein
VFSGLLPEVSIDESGVFRFGATVALGAGESVQWYRGQLVPGRGPALAPAAAPASADEELAPIAAVEPDPGTEAVAFTPSAIVVSPAGDWLIRGTDAGGGEWVFRNGEPVALAGAPVTLVPGEEVRFDDEGGGMPAFFSMQANGTGDVVVGGRTSSGDDAGGTAVIILNSQRVILRQGDGVDLNSDGLANDDAYLGAFSTDGAFLSDSGWYYFTAEISDASGRLRGHGLLRAGICKADWDASGRPDSSDLAAFISEWMVSVAEGCPLADYDRDGVAAGSDVASFISDWLSAVGGGC